MDPTLILSAIGRPAMLLAAEPGAANAAIHPGGPVGFVGAVLPFLPLLAAAVVGAMLIFRAGREYADRIVVAGVGLSALCAIYLFLTFQAGHAAGEHGATNYLASTLYRWISLGGGSFIDMGFFVDPLTTTMLLVVTIVASMVVIYSIGYMRDHHGHKEEGYERFFAYLGLFVFSMCLLVVAGNFVVLYMGWELVGLSSYLLIGFYFKKPEAAEAAKKAFLVNRIGDFGFALGIFALYAFLSPIVAPGENPLNYEIAFKYADHLAKTEAFSGWSQANVVGLLLLCGALGKSAQFPLYVWLPEAMEGPTPVSALIHAATMVTAGIYMVARCGPIYQHAPIATDVLLVLGLIGAILAATIAIAQYDMKRILAYSTISQLAFMFVALGCGASATAIFHLFTHAFFKALLFLCAGGVMHAMGGIIDLRHFSGLRSIMPQTYWLMGVGCAALAGVPFLSGFFSKDEILHAAMYHNGLVGWLMMITAGLTAYYTFRMFFLCFHGPLRVPKEAGDHPHESPAVMLRPLYLLAFGAVLAGYVGMTIYPSVSESIFGFLKPHGPFHEYLHESTMRMAEHHSGGMWVAYTSILIALGGIGLAYVQYGQAPQEDSNKRVLGPLWTVLNRKYWMDEIFGNVFVKPLRLLSHACFGADRGLVDGTVNVVGYLPRGVGFFMQFFHRGALQGYALTMILGLAVLVILWKYFESPAAEGVATAMGGN